VGAGDLIRRAGEALLGLVRPVDRDGGERGERPAAVPATMGPLTVDTVARLRQILRAHDEGDLMDSGCLAERMLCDADVVGALGQRILALQACPVRVHPADDSAPAKAAAEELLAAWGRIVTRAAMVDLVCGAIFLGVAVGQLVWYPGPDGRLEPRLEPWPWHAVEYRAYERRWYVYTSRGAVPITPGDGQWVVFTPRSEMMALAWGVIRCIGTWAVRAEFGAADLSRHVEVQGSPAWVVSVPNGQRKSEDAVALIRGLRNIGRNAVIPTPKGKTAEESYDVRLEQAKAEASKVFELLLKVCGGKIRLAILGQDLTSQNNTVGTNASSGSGENVTDLVVMADAVGFSECMTAQVAAPWARYRGTPPSRIEVDATRERDAKASAEASTAVAEAVEAWAAAGVEVDAVAHATEAGMKGAKPKAKAAPTP
jgi:phage gp29-like protein